MIRGSVRLMAECLDELSLVSQAVLAVSRQMPVRQVLQVIVDSARTLADARYAALGVPDERGSFGEFVVSGLTAAQQRAIGPLPRQHGMLAELLRGAKPERLPDITADARYGGWLPQAHPPMGPFIGVPVMHGDEVLGIILAANKTTGGEFTSHDEELLTLFAAHAAIALTNARLHEDSRELSAVEERARLARELHDAVSQKLFSIRAHARAASVLAERDPTRAAVAMSAVSELAAEAQAELRAVIEGLAPPALDGLVASLRRYADLAGRAHGVRVSVTERSVPPLDPATEVALYRVAQEALHNALRHSGGRCVTISVSGASRRIVLEVTDDGSGFDPLSAQGSGLGLTSMRQRAATAGGTVQVVSAPGQGTTVRLETPVRAP
ncbi:MAG: putative two-component system sensor kinase [Actinomycetia bacterium]|nr:putative two-component system sensor kinase [Actinomycetes bacterium]